MPEKKVIIIIIIFILSIILFCCLYPEDKDYELRKKKRREEYINESVKEICIKGHTYYYYLQGHSASFSIKFNNDGTPVKCELEKQIK